MALVECALMRTQQEHLIAFGKEDSRAVVLGSGNRHKKLPVRNIS
jgi:hypothetical protein